MIDLLTVGEAMASLRGAGPVRLGGSLVLSVAGAEANVAIGISRLGHTARWVGVVGADELGSLVLRSLRAEGVLVDATRVEPARPTGLVLFERRIADVSRVTYWRAGSAGSQVSADDVRAAAGQASRWVHVTGVTAALGDSARAAVTAALDVARATGARVSLDVNFRAALWPRGRAAVILGEIARKVDMVIASEDELDLVAPGDARDEEGRIAALLEAGVAEVVVKRGADGASAYTERGVWTQPARPVPVVDTIGAGDAFTAGYLSGALDGLQPEQRLARAVACGAFAVAAPGDWEGLPTRAELALLDVASGTNLR